MPKCLGSINEVTLPKCSGIPRRFYQGLGVPVVMTSAFKENILGSASWYEIVAQPATIGVTKVASSVVDSEIATRLLSHHYFSDVNEYLLYLRCLMGAQCAHGLTKADFVGRSQLFFLDLHGKKCVAVFITRKNDLFLSARQVSSKVRNDGCRLFLADASIS